MAAAKGGGGGGSAVVGREEDKELGVTRVRKRNRGEGGLSANLGKK